MALASLLRIDHAPLLAFMGSAFVALWISYDPLAGARKFLTLTLGFLIYLVLSRQPKKRASFLLGGMIAVACLISVYFLLSNDWYRWPVDYDLIIRVASWWMKVRPAFVLTPFHPNAVGGALILLLPFTLAGGVLVWQRGEFIAIILVILAMLLTGSALVLTSSRAAWVAFAIGAGAAIGIWMLKRYKFNRIATAIGSLSILAITLRVASMDMDFNNWLTLVPGMETRAELLRNAFYLTQDFAFTGGGLGSFPGLYSRYMLVIPFVFLNYGHNLYLDLLIEQGFPGLFTFLVLMTIAFWWTIRVVIRSNVREREFMLSLAVFSSLLMVILHGFIDDPLYGGSGNPLLFLIPGWAVFLYTTDDLAERTSSDGTRAGFRSKLIVLISVLIVLLIGWNGRKLLAGVHANLGAIQMAKIDLNGWPDEEQGWGETEYPPGIARHFNLALRYDLKQTTAHYRLGLMAMETRDFPEAITHLSNAFRYSPEHRGVLKNLGYAYVWEGELVAALPLLEQIPEARQELTVYEWWWGMQGEAELSQRAALAVSRLQ